MKVIKRIGFKAKNRRVTLMVLQDKDENILFLIITRRLLDFKNRQIIDHEFWATLETFIMVKDIINMAIGNDNVVKKLILDDIISVKKTKVDCKIFQKDEFYVV